MDPHFIFNCINSIQNNINSQNLEVADKYLSKFATLLRMILETSKKAQINLADEIKLLEGYLEMEVFRFHGNLEYHITVSEDLEPALYDIPNMLIQPFVENSIKHGLKNKQKVGKVLISFDLNEDILTVIVEDNGIGREASLENQKETGKDHVSTAMELTARRLELLHIEKSEEDQARITVHDLFEKGIPSGTRVEILLPV